MLGMQLVSQLNYCLDALLPFSGCVDILFSPSMISAAVVLQFPFLALPLYAILCSASTWLLFAFRPKVCMNNFFCFL